MMLFLVSFLVLHLPPRARARACVRVCVRERLRCLLYLIEMFLSRGCLFHTITWVGLYSVIVEFLVILACC